MANQSARFMRAPLSQRGISARKANEWSWGPDFAQDIADQTSNGHPGITYWKKNDDGKWGFTQQARVRFQKYGAEQLAKLGTNPAGNDLSKEATIKFVNTGDGASTGGIGVIPIGLDLRRIDLSREGIIFTPGLERVAHDALTVQWNYIDADTPADFFASSRDGGGATGDFGPSGDIAVKDDDYDNHSRTIKGLYTVGQVADIASAIAGDGRGLYQEVFDAKMRSMDLAIEKQNLLSTGTGGDAEGYTSAFDIWDGVTVVDKNSSSVDLADLDTQMTGIANANQPEGLASVDFGITDYATHASLVQQGQTFTRMDATGNALGAAGAMPFVYRGVPIYPSQVMPTTASAKRLYLVSRPKVKMYTVMDNVFIPLARTLTTAAGAGLGQSFALESWLTLVDFSAKDAANSDGTGCVASATIREIA